MGAGREGIAQPSAEVPPDKAQVLGTPGVEASGEAPTPGVTEELMKRTYSKLAAQPEHGVHRPRPEHDSHRLTTADRVRLSLLASPPRRGGK